VIVKICGNRRREDVVAAIDAGANAVGFVVATPRSPRDLMVSDAASLIRLVPPLVDSVVVTAARSESTLRRLAMDLNPGAIQIQGMEDLALLDRLRGTVRARIVVGMAVESDASVAAARRLEPHCDAIVLDSSHGGRLGGTGRVHDWTVSRTIRDAIHPFPVILAGGLSPTNVASAIQAVQPFAVDVASGVESGGFKSRELVNEFVREARNG